MKPVKKRIQTARVSKPRTSAVQQLVINIETNCFLFGDREMPMNRRKPSLFLLVELCDYESRNLVMLYRLLRHLEDYENKGLDDEELNSRAASYINAYLSHLRHAIKVLGAPVHIKRFGRGSEAKLQLVKNDIMVFRVESGPLTRVEAFALKSARQLLDADNYLGCLDLLESRIFKSGLAFKNNAALYCCIASMKNNDYEAALLYFERVYRFLLPPPDKCLYDTTCSKFLAA